jgi:uncharacterized protein (TIGR03084 family)
MPGRRGCLAGENGGAGEAALPVLGAVS